MNSVSLTFSAEVFSINFCRLRSIQLNTVFLKSAAAKNILFMLIWNLSVLNSMYKFNYIKND